MSAPMPTRTPADVAIPPSDSDIRGAILDHALRRGAGKTFCPSEPARALSLDRRALMPAVRAEAALMPAVRAEAARMQAEGLIEATQRGQPVLADQARGPIRLRLSGGAR
jgi:hypothetical protein